MHKQGHERGKARRVEALSQTPTREQTQEEEVEEEEEQEERGVQIRKHTHRDDVTQNPYER